MPFVTKGKKKNFVDTKFLPPDEQSLHMKILRANLVSCSGANCVNQHFEILNLVDYGWKVAEGKLEPNGLRNQLFHLLKTLTRKRIISKHYQVLVKANTKLPLIRTMKMKVFAYPIRTMKKNRIGHCASSRNASIISLTFLYMETSK